MTAAMLTNSWFEPLYQLGIEQAAQDRFEAASRCLRAACMAAPNHAPAWQELALVQLKLGSIRPALQSIRRALQLNPESPRGLSIAAMIGTELGHFEQALLWIDLAKQQEPDNLGLELIAFDIFRLTEQWIQAEEALTQAINKGADTVDVAFLHCELLHAMSRTSELENALNSLISKHPERPKARIMLAELQLSRCNYTEGWANHEYRSQLPEHPILHNYPWPYWSGESLLDKTILVYAEQGVGDEIMFASCLPDLLKIAHKTLFVCDERLAQLFNISFPQLETLAFSEVPEIASHHPQSVDYCVAIGSLPLHFRQSATDFPTHKGYLQTNDEWVQPWREKLQGLGNSLKIGIAWQGGLMRTSRIARSLQPEQLLPLLELPNIQFISIQHGKVRRELEWLTEKHNLPVTTWPLDTKNMMELASLVSALDLIITPCCSLVHLAGALGKPVWVMTPKVAAWRYLNEGETMPWYPSARLFRQPESGDWANVIESIRQQLIQKTGV
jgi:tetratricopeptide (TPR) repeat protein